MEPSGICKKWCGPRHASCHFPIYARWDTTGILYTETPKKTETFHEIAAGSGVHTYPIWVPLSWNELKLGKSESRSEFEWGTLRSAHVDLNFEAPLHIFHKGLPKWSFFQYPSNDFPHSDRCIFAEDAHQDQHKKWTNKCVILNWSICGCM
jgi:hypothetical protein